MEEAVAYMQRCNVVPVDEQIALQAVSLAARFRLHAMDALIAATAKLVSAELLTLDAHLLRVPGSRQP